jgi:hypothetical protein|tara:strand:+ start:119 stop:499 length:381 start_codon:yes stop_codon:yes gene_type:complete
MNNIIKTFVADGAITEFALVSTTNAGKVTVTTARDDSRCIGVAQRACSDGEVVDVLIQGESRVIVGAGGLAAGDTLVMATTAGAVVPHQTTGSYSIGQILPTINQASSSANEQVLIKFTGPNNLLP